MMRNKKILFVINVLVYLYSYIYIKFILLYPEVEFIDNVVYIFKGGIITIDNFKIENIPLYFIIVNFLNFLNIVFGICDKTAYMEHQNILKTKSRLKWYISKFRNIIKRIFLFYLTGYFVIFFCACFECGNKVFSFQPRIYNSILKVSDIKEIFIFLIIPILYTLLVASCYLIFYIIKKDMVFVIAYILCFFSSLFEDSKLKYFSYNMLLKNHDFCGLYTKSPSTNEILLFSVGLLLILFLSGAFLVNKVDIDYFEEE